MLLKFLHPNSPGAQSKAKRSSRAASAKRIGPDRPVRVYSLLLPPTLPRDRQ
jgi:hypothetical protein